jgi:hypothetical protein
LVNLKLENYCHLWKFRISNLVNCKLWIMTVGQRSDLTQLIIWLWHL